MKECEAIKQNKPKTHIKSNTLTHDGKTMTHKKSHGVKQMSVTQKNGTTATFYCNKHGQNPTHPTDKCYTLKKLGDEAKGTSTLGFNKKSFGKDISILAKGRPRKKVLEMFAIVLQQEHKVHATKTSKKTKNNKIILNESSNSANKNMSIDPMTVSTMDKVESPSKQLTDKTDKTDQDKTYQSRIENLGAITKED
jgi:hypothetical protein